ncbi:site-specific DNA-methyltransferase [uncultured Phascolarctobacterium sp.]|uniref:site-specific DNA-methyltransferase n=1 Tax=uncultured Phascolarctobacterium sp. TaxID=512296 RepID=UPI0025FC109D|nr:site-specific DNA-methyltransferase [uncultured Phascolarctobacterium sp.]
MKHLNMQSMDKVAANVAKIRKLFPNCVTERINAEGKLEHAIDFDMLKQELSDHVVDGLQERYQFTWPDKRSAILAANAPINKTLRPCREESVDFDNTENLYIEGDNLEVLKLLQETYLGKVKMIYIDPPYNTGRDFVYNDNFRQSAQEYIVNSGQLDSEGNRLEINSSSEGRYHTNWLNMMYPRLKLAKDLLSDDGVIFISIDENEVRNLMEICNEIFGENNLVADIPWQSRASIQNDTDFSINHEYIIVYAKIRRTVNRRLKESNYKEWIKRDSFVCKPLPLDKSNFDNPDNDPRGLWKSDPFDAPNIRPNLTYEIINPNTGVKHLPPRGRCWRTDAFKFANALKDNRIVFGSNGNGRPQLKVFYDEKKLFGSIDNSWFSADRVGTTTNGTKELIKIFDGIKAFDTPKPVSILSKLLYLANLDTDSLILDFFSGSATTAHAVMQLNAEDGGKRKFIMVQLQEECAENSEAYKAGYKNICEIGKERIRRAGKKIKEENPLTTQDLDIGFRVLKCDSSNMEDVYFTPKEYMDKQQSLFVDNIKKDRSDEDLLFDAMLKLDTPLSSKIERLTIAGKTVYNVAQGHLMACFDQDVTDEVITAIAKEMPSYFVMRDSSQADDSVAINFEQIFNTYSPLTVRRVL